MPCNCSNAGSNNGQSAVGGNGGKTSYPPVPEPRPTLEEIRYLLRGYDELGTLLPDAAILTNADGEVDQIRCDTLYVNNIECLDSGCSLFTEQWSNPDATTVTVGGVLENTSGTTLIGLSAIQVLERILYAFTPAAITSFTAPFLSQLDLGQSIGGAGPFTFNFTVSNPSSVSNLSLAFANNNSNYSILASVITPTSTSYTGSIPSVTSVVPGYFVSFRLRAIQSDAQYADSQSFYNLYWWSSIHYGKATSTDEKDYRNFDVDLGSQLIATVSSSTQTIPTTGGGGYVYFFIHNSRSITSIFQGPLDVTSAFIQQDPSTVNGITYKVYRSTEFVNDDLTFTVNSGPA